MVRDPILLIGGSGVIGRWTAKFLREAHPVTPLLIGGRDLAKARRAADEIGHAEGVVIDLTADDLGLGSRPVSAVAIFLKDDRLASLRFAQARGVPHLSISSLVHEMGPEVATFMHRPAAAPVVLGTEWLVGAVTLPTLDLARAFGRVDDITLGALLDEQDTGGPTTAVDLERLNKTMPAALVRRDGNFVWLVGDEAKGSFRAADGTEMQAAALSGNDVVALANLTGAPNVRFNLATGVSSSRRRGEAMSTEILIELAGVDRAGRPLRTRHAVVHRDGQMPPTGFGVAMVLERLLGLDGGSPVPAGLYFPCQLLRPERYLPRFKATGGSILELQP